MNLTDLRKLSEAAEPGPWFYWDEKGNDFIATGKDEGKLIAALPGFKSNRAEFKFIAAACNFIRSLLADDVVLVKRDVVEQSITTMKKTIAACDLLRDNFPGGEISEHDERFLTEVELQSINLAAALAGLESATGAQVEGRE